MSDTPFIIHLRICAIPTVDQIFEYLQKDEKIKNYSSQNVGVMVLMIPQQLTVDPAVASEIKRRVRHEFFMRCAIADEIFLRELQSNQAKTSVDSVVAMLRRAGIVVPTGVSLGICSQRIENSAERPIRDSDRKKLEAQGIAIPAFVKGGTSNETIN